MKNHHFHHLMQRIFNEPVAILPQKASVITAALSDRLGITSFFAQNAAAESADEMGHEDYGQANKDMDSSYAILEQCAIIPISGTLVQKTGTLSPYSGMTGYDGIRQNFLHALENTNVKAIVLDINSGGGEVSGCFDLVDTIYAARGEKPIVAILNESAYSAAYAIASAADVVTVPRTGGTGSIGVICMHCDYSEALEKAGLNVTMVTYGEKKSWGNQYEPIKTAALEKTQADVDAMGELFVAVVARNRGLSVEKIRAMQAGTFLGKEGVDIGLADELLSPHVAFMKLVNTI